jgi:cytokinin dehydrogenase
MRSGPTRRHVLGGLAAGALVTGFDPVSRDWVTDRAAGFPVPRLKGQLLLGGPAAEAAADDFGHIIHRQPRAVLQPGDVNDVVVMVRFCNEHRIPVAARGQGHATYGQAQVAGGLVIDTGPLDAIGVGTDTVEVQAGARWSSLLNATLPHRLTPPVLTDYLELSVGGTLSVGGSAACRPTSARRPTMCASWRWSPAPG